MRLATIGVAISSNSMLEWTGFQDNGAFFTFDNCGVLRVMHNESWFVVLDTRKSKNDRIETYWPVGLTESSLMCVVCKGGDKYPPFPKPLLHEITLQIPLLNLDNPQGKFEEKRNRSTLAMKSDLPDNEKLAMQIEMDKLTLQLLQVN